MAKQTYVQLIDDIDGTVLGPDNGESVSFGLDGKTYSIDLSETNAQGLRSALKKYIDHATTVKGSRRASRAAKSNGSRRSAQELKHIRQWARDKGYTVADRGRIRSEILDAYDTA